MRRLASFLILATLIASCGKKGTTSPQVEDYGIVSCGDGSATIILTFTAPNGNTPITGASVSIGNCTGKTDKDGRIQMVNVPAGSYILTIEKGIFKITQSIDVQDGQELDLGKLSIPPDLKKMLVIVGSYDRIQDILSRLGFAFDTMDCYTFSSNSDTSYFYDYIFFNCGAGCDAPSLADTLKKFLNDGNRRIYTSDWAYYIAEVIDSSAIDFYGDDTYEGSAKVGEPSEVTGYIQDNDLKEALGRDTMLINYNLDSWVVMEGTGSQTDILISGNAPTYNGVLNNVPFAVIYSFGQGKVIFTSFHNEAQNTQDMDIILEQMILK